MLKAIFKSMRPRQWTKNVFILPAIIFDRQLTNPTAIMHTAAGFLLFCLVSSIVYIINDIADAEADRQHPKKRFRPIASGELPVPTAITAVVVLILICIPLSFWLSIEFGVITTFYLLMQLAYSKWLKHIPLIDVMILAAGFVLRVAAGVSLIEVERFSPWLYVVITFLALFLGLGKRRNELVTLADGANSHRPVLEGYSIPFLDQLIMIVCSITIMAYSLYTFSAINLPENHAMMLTIPFAIYAIFRWLYLIQVRQEGGAPEDMLLSDRPMQITIVLFGLAVLFIFYIS